MGVHTQYLIPTLFARHHYHHRIRQHYTYQYVDAHLDNALWSDRYLSSRLPITRFPCRHPRYVASKVFREVGTASTETETETDAHPSSESVNHRAHVDVSET